MTVDLSQYKIWTEEEFEAVFPPVSSGRPNGGAQGAVSDPIDIDDLNFPDDLRVFIRDGVPEGDRSDVFFLVVKALRDGGYGLERIYDVLSRYPDGIAKKYVGRLWDETKRAFDKLAAGRPRRARAPRQPSWTPRPSAPSPGTSAGQGTGARFGPASTGGRQAGASLPPSPQPTNLETAVAVYHKWLALKNDWPVYVTLGTIAANLLEGRPVWLGIIGPSSSAKTALLNSVSGLKDAAGKRFMHEVETFSPAGLLSGSSRKTRAPGATGGVLPKLGRFGVLVFMDFGSVLSLRQDPQAEMMSALRRVYDGHYTRDPGTDGGLHLEWRGKAGCLFGATQKYDGHHGLIGALGDRFLLLRIDAMLDEQLDMCRLQLGAGAPADQELAQAAGGLFASLPSPLPAPERMDDQEYEALKKAIRLAVRLRAGVVRDGYKREIDDVHDPEGPARFSLALQQLFAGLVLIGVDRAEAHAIVEHIAFDSAPRHRLVALRALTDSLQSTIEISEQIGQPKTPTRRALEDLAAQRLAHLEMENRLLNRGFGGAPTAVECWKRTALAASLM